ncbi:hypothetical protein CDD82_2466 [Ophiocordyceps australis]|uniref:amidase n=1 Tax=Ophiocordyceps australis TaxID=1399860 RepID=A0A2C5ZTF8_9HYPO|nr:hypothetical protein CDD82_2466 [Ophiocordyceps australis]
MFLLEYLQHRKDCQFKQNERAARIRALPARYHAPFSPLDRQIINQPIEELVKQVHSDPSKASDLLDSYAKVALKAQEKTNCITEILIEDAQRWISNGSINFKGPLAGIPISLKDTVDVGGYDSTVGMTCNVHKPKPVDGGTVKLLKELGAVPYVKTNIPITLLSFESANDIWGRSTNPYNSKYTPGGSTGGEGALLALGGRIGIGSDVAGSVRCPAHFSGIYALKCSTGRWPKQGLSTSMPGQEGIPAVYSPMARTMDDLFYFTHAVLNKETWRFDHTCHPVPWRQQHVVDVAGKKSLRVGIMRTDDVIDPSPACKRALEMAEVALKRDGHQIVEIDPPSPYDGLCVASHLLCADGLQTPMGFFRSGEWNDRGVARLDSYARLPRFVKYLHYLWVRYVRRDPVWAGLIRGWHSKTTREYWALIARREAYKRDWFNMWEQTKLDFIISPPNATPAVPHNGMHDAVSSCGYTFLFNLLDYSAGVIPVTHVDRTKDQLPSDFNVRKLNGLAQGAYKLYNADAMHGLPVGVQVIGRRLEEEKVLAMMQRLKGALERDKHSFQLLEVD